MPVPPPVLLAALSDRLLPVAAAAIEDFTRPPAYTDPLFPGSTDVELADALKALITEGHVDYLAAYGSPAPSNVDLLVVPGITYGLAYKARLQSR